MIGDKKSFGVETVEAFHQKTFVTEKAAPLLDNQFHLATAVARQLKTPMLQYWVQALLALND